MVSVEKGSISLNLNNGINDQNNHFFVKQIWEGEWKNSENTTHLHRIVECYGCSQKITLCKTDPSCNNYNMSKCEELTKSEIDRLTKIAEKINIVCQQSHKKCKCNLKFLNCLDQNLWKQKQFGVISFDYKQEDYDAKKIHPAVYPIDLVEYFIELFTHKGELVVDPFGGTGTTLEAALNLDRNGISIDLSKKYTQYANNRIPCGEMNSKLLAVQGNSQKIANLFPNGSIKLLITSPPYANLLTNKITHRSRKNRERDQSSRQYSQKSEDLGTMEIDDFIDQLGITYRNFYSKLVSNGQVVINICNDIFEKEKQELVLFPSKIINKMIELGYRYKNKFIWDRTKYYSSAHIFGYPSNFLTYSGSYELILHFTK